MLPEDFALRFLINRFDMFKIVIGYDFRFGKNRAGDFKLLENLSQQFNFSLEEWQEYGRWHRVKTLGARMGEYD